MKAERTARLTAQRRGFLRTAASVAGLALASCAATGTASGARAKAAPHDKKEEEDADKEGVEAEVTPGEDLMQEHGVLERILLIYDESIRRIEHGQPLDMAVITSAAGLIRRFVEDYHEKQEEQFVFPRLQAARRELDLVTVLLRQHERGRQLTDEIVRKAQAGERTGLEQSLRNFVRMYRPHASREETVLFPAFRGIVGRAGYRELGDQFEEKEHQLFGEDGFSQVVSQVADLERVLEIYDLASFTPA